MKIKEDLLNKVENFVDLRVIKFNLKKEHEDYILFLTQMKQSKLIRNFLNFIIRQYYFKSKNQKYNLEFIKEYEGLELSNLLKEYYKNEKILNDTLLSKIACEYNKTINFETNLENDYKFNTKVVQTTYRSLKADWNSYFALLKKKNKGEYDKKINLPRKTKEKYFLVNYNKQALSKTKLINGFVGSSNMKIGINLSKKYNNYEIQAMEFRFKNGKIKVDVIYKKEFEPFKNLDYLKVMGIDVGVDNLVTCSFNFNSRGFKISGKDIKRINQTWNRKISKLYSSFDKCKNINTFVDKLRISNRISKLTFKRNETMTNRINRITRLMIEKAISLNVCVIVFGWNKEIKREINIGN